MTSLYICARLKVALEKANSKGIISPAYHTFHGENIDSRFYYAYFHSKEFINKDLKTTRLWNSRWS